jgi:2',3'-cyclic-nucleotide 2'-phosphodiesterase
MFMTTLDNWRGSWAVRILFIGDVVGRSGMDAIRLYLPQALSDWEIDLTIVNGENAATSGFGITEAIYNELLEVGADVITLGNHSWNQKEALEFIGRAPRLIRPINYLPTAPGHGAVSIETKTGRRALIINALGRMFMEPVENPFAPIDRELNAHRLGKDVEAIVVDFHCEATGEKQGAGHFCDGRASLVVGTHTHTPSADHQILPRGTAYMSDVGMTGDYDSIVGMQKDEPLRRFTTGIPMSRFMPATGPATMSGVAVETDEETGLASKIAPVRIGGRLERAVPLFWA